MGSEIQLSKAPFSDQIVEAVLGMIGSGEFFPGDRITELDLIQRLGVSRTPVREAMVRLAESGVLERRATGGYALPELSAETVREVIDARMLMEPIAIRIVAEQADAKALRILDRIIQEQREAMEDGDGDRASQLDSEFRNAIFDMAPNRFLRQAIAQFEPHLHFVRAISRACCSKPDPMLDRQMDIRKALAARDGDAAEARWRAYLNCTEDFLMKLVQSWEQERGRKAASAV